jgi:hypothetical protein
VWVITYPAHQPRSYRVVNDVPRNLHHILIPSQGSVVIATLPDWVRPLAGFSQCMTGSRLEAAHQSAERRFFQLDQPMHMIRHHYPSKGPAVVFLVGMAKVPDYQPGRMEIMEQRPALVSSRGKQIDPAGFGASTSAEQAALGSGHVIILEQT